MALPEGAPVQVHVPEKFPTSCDCLTALDALDAVHEELTEEQDAPQRTRHLFGPRALRPQSQYLPPVLDEGSSESRRVKALMGSRVGLKPILSSMGSTFSGSMRTTGLLSR